MPESIAQSSSFKMKRSRPTLWDVHEWIKYNTFGIGMYTIAAGILGINIDPTDPIMRIISVIGIILGALASALGVFTKLSEIIKSYKSKKKTSRKTKSKK